MKPYIAFRAMWCALLMVGLSAGAFADDSSATGKLEEAKRLYEQREDAAKVEAASKLLDEAALEAEDTELQYDILVFHSLVLYWQGLHTNVRKEKIQIHDKGRALADQAHALHEEYAEALYWSGAHLGRWGEANGVVQSLSKKPLLEKTLKAVLERDTRDFEAGESYSWYGADRVLGRLYFKLPIFAGGSRDRALKHLRRAYENAPEHVLNVLYYAEALYAGDRAEKAEARRILDELLTKRAEDLIAERVPESREEMEQARLVRAEMGN